MEDKKVLFFGVGAIGGSIGAWVAEKYENAYFLDQGEIAAAVKEKGITAYLENEKDKAASVKVKTVSSLAECPDPDVVVLAVKTYSLEKVLKILKKSLKKEPIIVALQNGVENQKILPKYFKKVVYGVISYNAWLDEPAVVGYQKKGPLIIGTPDNSLREETETVAGILNKGVETIVTDHLGDAAHSKLIVNLSNSLTTLIGLRYVENIDMKSFKKVLTSMMHEGIKAVKAAGYSECKLGGMPSWSITTLGWALPYALAKGIFTKNVAKMVLSSMAQDVLQRKGHETELEILNGYILSLGEKNGVKMPYNKAVYELCKTEFAKDDFKPLPAGEVLAAVKKYK
jgi:2-dehydropantoate 2-reductase